jgi:hypothetical protein
VSQRSRGGGGNNIIVTITIIRWPTYRILSTAPLTTCASFAA